MGSEGFNPQGIAGDITASTGKPSPMMTGALATCLLGGD